MNWHYTVKPGIYQHFTEGAGLMITRPLGEHPHVALVCVGRACYTQARCQKQFSHFLSVPAENKACAPGYTPAKSVFEQGAGHHQGVFTAAGDRIIVAAAANFVETVTFV